MYRLGMIEDNKMVIETERLMLREYTLDDFDALYEIMSDPDPKNTISYAYAITRGEWKAIKGV